MVSDYGSLLILFMYICIGLCRVYIPCVFSLFYPLFILFSYALIVIYLFSKKREKEDMELDRYKAWEEIREKKVLSKYTEWRKISLN